MDFLYVFDNNVPRGEEPILLLERKPGQKVKCYQPELIVKWFGDLGKKICEHRFTEFDDDETVWSEPRSKSESIDSVSDYTSGESYQEKGGKKRKQKNNKKSKTFKKLKTFKKSKTFKKLKTFKKSKIFKKSKKN